MAKAKTTRTKSKSAGTARKPAAKSGVGKKTAGKKTAGKKSAAKASYRASNRAGNKAGDKAGDKLSPRALAKASVKPSKPPAPKPAKPKAPKLDDKTLKSILHSLNEMKAEDTVVIDLSDKSSIGETMVVTTGRSNVHLQAIADRVIKDLKATGMTGIAVEGLRQGDWVVIDTGSVLVHVFRPEVRAFYGIENMWSA
jgi:ribosome-associated protein